MAITPLVDGQYAGVSTFLNSIADGIDNLGEACVVRRTEQAAAVPPNTDFLCPWQALDLDTSGGGMFNLDTATTVTIREPGIYSLTCQMRWPYWSTTSPYNTGTRSARIMVDSTTPSTGSVASDKKPWSVDGEGVTLSMTATARLAAGVRIFVGLRHTASGNLDCLHTDFGGTYLSVSRIGPY